MRLLRWLNSTGLVLTALLFSPALHAAEYFVYFGTFTDSTSTGIYVSRFDPDNGKLSAPQLAAESDEPSFLAVAPNHRFLYAVNEFNGDNGTVTAFQIDAKTGKLTQLNQQTSGGVRPAHLVVDASGKFVVAANYLSGNVEVLPIKADGSLGAPVSVAQDQGSSIDTQRQDGPHAHCIAMDASNRVYVCDLGADKVMIYDLDAQSGQLTTNGIPWATMTPGSGPRHIALHPDGKYAYVISELASTMTAFARNPSSGELTQLQTLSTLPEDFHGNNTGAEVAIHPSGKFLYGSNRGYNSITTFAIDEKTGKLNRIQIEPVPGKTLRSFAIDPTGQFLIAGGQDSDNVVVFRINPKNGKLVPTGQNLDLGEPVCVMFVPEE
ncbi:MAG TPA: lactonase family protein [Verrucomicrobiae bacterium]|jgi:6-phosphogluconolactonase